MPGVTQRGLPVSSLGGATLSYHCNAYVSLYATIAIVASLHFSGIFNLGDIIDLYGPLLSVASLSGFGLAAVIYGAEVWGTKEGGYRMSGNVVYDYFMGACLNPRVLGVDVKMWAEIRISWILLWALAMGAVVKQWQEYGFVSPNVVLFAYGTGLYLNACAKVSCFEMIRGVAVMRMVGLTSGFLWFRRERNSFLRLGVSFHRSFSCFPPSLPF